MVNKILNNDGKKVLNTKSQEFSTYLQMNMKITRLSDIYIFQQSTAQGSAYFQSHEKNLFSQKNEI